MRQLWSKLGGQLGVGCIVAGLLAIGLAWNGAAGVDFAQGQIPYLLSGGAFGIGLIVLGAALVVVQASRRDRAVLEAQLVDLNQSITRLASAIGATAGTNGTGRKNAPAAELVLVGRSSYHRPECRLADGKDLAAVPVATAVSEGLKACRICKPVVAAV
jgi:hypothetical protein